MANQKWKVAPHRNSPFCCGSLELNSLTSTLLSLRTLKCFYIVFLNSGPINACLKRVVCFLSNRIVWAPMAILSKMCPEN